MWIERLGFWALIALLLVLPFDPSGYPVFAIDGAEVTPPDLVFLIVGLLASLSLARDTVILFRGTGRPSPSAGSDSTGASVGANRIRPRLDNQAAWWPPSGGRMRFAPTDMSALAGIGAGQRGQVPGNGGSFRGRLLQSRHAVAAGLLAATLVSMVITCIVSGGLASTAVWLLDIAAGGCIALALPVWLTATWRVSCVAVALVAGAVVAAILGFGEYLIGSPLERILVVFRPGPTTMGPYLRLTSVFHHTNIAAMYFELALPFAAAGFVSAARRISAASRRQRLLPVMLWGASVNILLLALLLTYSRGAVLGVLAALAVAAWALRGTLRGRLSAAGARWLLTAGANLALLVGLFLASTSSIEALRLTSGTDEGWYRVGYTGAPPSMMRPGSQVAVRVTVQNLSPLAWQSQRRGDYALSYHWLRPSYRVARFDTAIAALPLHVPAGGRRSVIASVVAPAQPGRYILIWDLLWHQRTWFDLKTGDLVAHRVDVVGPPVPVAPPTKGFSQPGDASLVTLPVSQAVGRTSIWEVGVRVFLRRPLFGGGLHAYFNDFPSFVPLASGARPPPHAHDLVLVLLDSWGLIGTLLLGALALMLWWPLLRIAGRGQISSSWQVAVLAAGAAFLAHGTVDYFFGATSVVGLVWVLGGLASAAGR